GSIPCVPGSAPCVPESAPRAPGSAPCVPGSIPCVPGSIPCVPGSAPCVPESAPRAPGTSGKRGINPGLTVPKARETHTEAEQSPHFPKQPGPEQSSPAAKRCQSSSSSSGAGRASL
uniref:Uncharacterized protein n=1 Tax=Corvus moneduloides TaxID=1196302 RepID=A0A8U7P514_CORMO